MILEDYYHIDHDRIRVSREQASRFAKQVAGDFNPIHDPDSRRFCVPGDLLFALVLARYGLSQKMDFHFSGLVDDQVALQFPPSDAEQIQILGDNGKEYLRFERQGALTRDPEVIERLIRVYVAFSGHAFPHLLVPLMREHQVMINPQRPMIIYQSMALQLDELQLEDPSLSLAEARLEPHGKRRKVAFDFIVNDGDRQVGRGTKRMVLSGLRPWDEAAMNAVVDDYQRRTRELAPS